MWNYGLLKSWYMQIISNFPIVITKLFSKGLGIFINSCSFIFQVKLSISDKFAK